MASEHEHEWMWRIGEHGATERRCECGNEDWYAPASELMQSLQQISEGKRQLEQQLAQAREELKDERKWKDRIKDEALHYLSEQERLKEENAQARALLEKFAVDETERIGLYWDESVGMAVCVYCESGNGHLPDCPMVKARAFLGKEA